MRKTLEISVVFDRLMGGSFQTENSDVKWSHVDLIKYLLSVWADVPRGDRDRLQNTPICPSEGAPSDRLFQISELYEPSDSLRRLGLRTLRWPGIYSPDSREGRLLHTLGLRSAPPYADLVNILATAGQSKDFALRDFGLRYFIENYQSKGYDVAVPADVKVPFLPVQGSDDRLSTPSDCFTNERSALLRFDLLRSDLHRHALQFGVQPDPPIDRTIRRLIRKPPQNRRQAREIFTYMTLRIGNISKQHADTLGEAKIVPVPTGSSDSDEKGNRIRLLSPRNCFLGDGGDFAKIFDFVDFSPEANMFLLHCGSKHKPETPEIAHLMTHQPGKFWELGVSRYMETLITLSRAWDTLKKDRSLVEKMKQSPFLLASKEINSDASSNGENEEEGGTKVWQLAKPSDIIIIDEIVNYHIFKADVIAAPQQDEILEDMYLQLGVPELGTLITQRQNLGNPLPDQSTALKLQAIIHERAPLYFHDYQKDAIRHDARWLEKSLTVQITRRITVRKWLRGRDVPHEESKTATLRREGSNYILMVTPEYDMWQVSQVLSSLLLHRAKWRDEAVLDLLLRSSLRSLQQRGFNVDKILRQKEKEHKEAQETYRQRLEQDQRAQKERDALQQELKAQRGPTDDKQATGDRQAIDDKQDSMPGEFPGSTDGKDKAAEERKEPESFLEGIGKRFGLDFGRKPRPALANGEGHEDGDTTADATREYNSANTDFESDVKGSGEPQTPQDKPMTPQELDAQ